MLPALLVSVISIVAATSVLVFSSFTLLAMFSDADKGAYLHECSQ